MFDNSFVRMRAHKRSSRLVGMTAFAIFSAIILTAIYNFTIGTRTAGAKVMTITVCASGCDFTTIQGAITAASNGDTISVAAGTYIEDVAVDKSLLITGAGVASTTISGPSGGSGSTVLIGASNVEIRNFKITREGNNAATWNDPLNTAGISIQGTALTGANIHDNLIVQNRTGIDVNNSNGHTIRNNVISDNRTGLIFRNQTDNLTVVENSITDNWTVGVLFLDASGGTNSPVQTALNSTFFNNNISGNWYGQIVDRQSGGSLPAPGTTNLKSFSGNWFGTKSPFITTANSAEPGYAAQIPITVPGGTAMPPGGQPEILGPASANFDIFPYLNSGTDTNVETTLGRGTYGFQGDFSGFVANTLTVSSTGASGTTPSTADNDYTRINSAVQAAMNGDTIILNGTFNWAEANAALSWSKGSNGAAGDLDDYSVLVPANRNNVTFTATSLGAASIQGPGDLSALDLEGVFFFDSLNGSKNQGWTISNIRFVDFDLAIGMFFDTAGAVDAFKDTKIQNNYIKIAKDLAVATDTFQNIGIHFSFGKNQLISGNTIEIDGSGVSDVPNSNFAAEVGMQSNTSGGDVYDGLQITSNVLRVLNAQSASPERVRGIWENSHGHLGNVTVSNNQFVNLAADNNPTVNLQVGFRITSHSSPTSTVKYQGNTVSGASVGFEWLSGSNFAGNQPVQLISNTIIGNNTGVLIQSEGSALLKFNRIVGNLVTGLNDSNTTAINITAENNWWGCNYNPGNGGAGCSGTPNGVLNLSPGTVDANPWLVLGLTPTPSTVAVGGTSALTASLRNNSDNVDTSLMGMGTFPDGVQVGFAGTLGTVTPTNATTASALASSMYTAGGTPGAGSASATVDSQTVTKPITITTGPLAALAFVQQPTNTIINGIIAPAVTVQAKDAFNNTVSGVSVTLSLSMGTGVLGGTLTQITDGSGIATFGNLSIDTAGSNKKLTATSGAITALSNAFTILPTPTIVYVDDDWVGLTPGTDPDGAGPATSFGYDAFATVQNGVNAVATNGQVIVAAGTYIEDVTINRTMIVSGAGSTSVISGAIGGPGSTVAITASNVEFKGFKVTREGNTLAQWNDPNLNSAGVSIAAQSVSGVNIHDNLFTQNRTGIDINNSNGHTVRNNVITDNRTGLIFRNQTDNLTVVENEITNNWTVGVLFLDASGGSNSPVQTALNCNFSNNNFSGNWYGQIVDRQTGGSLPAPGTNLKNFSANWLGTNVPVVTTANSTEPGYAAQIPFTVPGGTAMPPGGQPDIAGPASANFDFTPLLDVGTDTNVETTLGRGTYGFQGSFNVLDVIGTNAQTGATGRIQEGINLVNSSGTVKVSADTYTENVNVNKAATLAGTPTINGTLAASVAGAAISPGLSPGVINSGDLSLASGSTLTIETASNAGPGTGHDQVNVTGTVSLGGATLNLVNSFTPVGGTSFTIINNDGSDAVNGTFNGLPEGAVFTAGGSFFRITYAGGSNGNDVVLTANTLPMIVAGPVLTRQQGSPGSNSQLATATDAEDAANTLSIQISGDGGMTFGNMAINNGVTVSLTDGNLGAPGLNPDAMGKVFADVVASCVATNASFTLRVTDSGTLMATTTTSVTVTNNTPPVLSYASPQTVMPGQSLTVNPNAPPSDNGSIANIVVQSVTPGFTGTASVNPTTGEVMINNAGPPGSYSVTIRATDNCGGATGMTDASFVLNVNCPAITVNPPTVPNGFVGSSYNQALSATGGTAPHGFTLDSGSLPFGVNIVGSSLMGTPTTTGVFTFTIKATDSLGCVGTRAYTVVISGAGLQFYPLAHPIRLVDTRVGTSCNATVGTITGGTSLTVPARGTCDGVTIPANAAAVTGNVTTVGPVTNGFLTIYPSTAAQPQAANTNYQTGQTINNVFTVGLGAGDGAFKVFSLSTSHVVIDITGYFAPPGAGGLFFHPLPAPVRLLDTRAMQTACTMPGTPITASTEILQQGNAICGIPASAVALVGNATTVGPLAQGFLTLYPSDATRPLIASGNYQAGQTLNSPFTVGLSPSGNFTIFSLQQTDLVVDVLGYYSADASDTIGTGLLFSPMTPARLLDTRLLQTACFTPGVAIPATTDTPQAARNTCTIPATAQAIVGNATTVGPAAQGFLTFWPSDATRPTAATSNYAAGVNFNRHFTVGLGTDGAFKIYALTSTHLVVDVSGSFAP